MKVYYNASEINRKYDIAIRTDGGPVIALGHIMRCLSIAVALRLKNKRIIFICANSYPLFKLCEFDFDVIVLNSNYMKVSEESELLMPLIVKTGVRAILVDSYYSKSDFLSKLQSYCKVACIGTGNKYTFGMDLFLNYSFYPDLDWYKETFEKANTVLLLGAKYAPLGQKFWNRKFINVNKKVKNILLTAGGSDEHHACDKILEELNKHSELINVKKHVIIGPFFDNGNEIKTKWREDNIVFYEKLIETSDLFKNMDFAISASGTTLYELFVFGIPTVLFIMADNQKSSSSLDGKMVCCGDIREDNNIYNLISNKALELALSYDKRVELQRQMKGCVDGKGAIRIADALCELIQKAMANDDEIK